MTTIPEAGICTTFYSRNANVQNFLIQYSFVKRYVKNIDLFIKTAYYIVFFWYAPGNLVCDSLFD